MAVLGSRAVFLATLALAVVLRLGFALNRGLDPDESQHLHAAWLVHQGRAPYRDFWEHHTPLLYYLLAPVSGWLFDRPEVYLAGRLLTSAVGLVCLALVYRLARRLGPAVAMVAVALLALLPRFTETTTEVRPDVPALLCWLLALLALVRARERGSRHGPALAGVAQGIALALTPKALYGLFGLALALIAPALAAPDPRAAARRALGPLLRCAAGVLLVVFTGLVVLGGHGGWAAVRGLFDAALLQNLRFVDFMKAWPVALDGLGLLLLGLTGIAEAVRRHGRRTLGHPIHGTLLPASAGVAAVLVLPTTPAVYPQAWLPVLPVLAVYAASALVGLAEQAAIPSRRAARVVLALAMMAGLAVPAARSVYEAVRDRTSASFRIVRALLREVCPHEPIIDGTGLAVFRPSAHRYGVLITGVREWIARGVLAEETFEEDFRRARARVVLPDTRVRGLVGPVEDFLRRHYVPANDGLLVAGATVPVRGGPAGGRAVVELVVPGLYWLTATAGIEVAIDGMPRPRGAVTLPAGRRVVTWTGPAGMIALRAAGCPERRALAAGATEPADAQPRP